MRSVDAKATYVEILYFKQFVTIRGHNPPIVTTSSYLKLLLAMDWTPGFITTLICTK